MVEGCSNVYKPRPLFQTLLDEWVAFGFFSSNHHLIKVFPPVFHYLFHPFRGQQLGKRHTKQNAISSPTDSNQRYIAISFLQISEDTFNKKKWSYFKGFPKSSCCLSELCLRCVEYVIKCRLFTGTETWQCEVLKSTHQQNWIISW